MEQQKTRVLIVDDNGQVRRCAQRVFQGQEDVARGPERPATAPRRCA